MHPESRDAAYLWDIIRATEKTIRSTEGIGLREYLANEDLRLTVERRLEIIGDAAKRISEAFRAEHLEIPWGAMIGQRNVMAHQYDEIDHERVWNVVQQNLPELMRLIEPLVPPPPSEDAQQ